MERALDSDIKRVEKKFREEPWTVIVANPAHESVALEKDSRSNPNSDLLTWVHGAAWDPHLVDQPVEQPMPGSKQHLPWAFVRIPQLPESVEDFVALRDELAHGPEGARQLQRQPGHLPPADRRRADRAANNRSS